MQACKAGVCSGTGSPPAGVRPIKGQTCLAASAACRIGLLAGMWTLVGHGPSS